MEELERLRFTEEPGRGDARSVLLRVVDWVELETEVVMVQPGRLRVRTLSEDEVRSMLNRRGQVDRFAGARRHEDFYGPRIRSMSKRVVIDARAKGDADQVQAQLIRQAGNAEQALVVAGWMTLGRKRLKRHMSHANEAERLDVTIGPGWKLRSSSGGGRKATPLRIDNDFDRRAHRLGVWRLAASASGEGVLPTALSSALFWLAEAAREPSSTAAIVKVSTALEAILSTSNRSITRNLSEGSAFLLTDEPARRVAVNKAVRRLYDSRSDSVHGGYGPDVVVPEEWLNAASKLVLAVSTVVSDNLQLWSNPQAVQDWVTAARWGSKTGIARSLDWRTLGPAVDRLQGKAT